MNTVSAETLHLEDSCPGINLSNHKHFILPVCTFCGFAYFLGTGEEMGRGGRKTKKEKRKFL